MAIDCRSGEAMAASPVPSVSVISMLASGA